MALHISLPKYDRRRLLFAGQTSSNTFHNPLLRRRSSSSTGSSLLAYPFGGSNTSDDPRAQSSFSGNGLSSGGEGSGPVPVDWLPCHVCGKLLAGRRCLRQHMQSSHSSNEQNTCRYCHKSYKNKHTLYSHISQYHREQNRQDNSNLNLQRWGRHFGAAGTTRRGSSDFAARRFSSEFNTMRRPSDDVNVGGYMRRGNFDVTSHGRRQSEEMDAGGYLRRTNSDALTCMRRQSDDMNVIGGYMRRALEDLSSSGFMRQTDDINLDFMRRGSADSNTGGTFRRQSLDDTNSSSFMRHGPDSSSEVLPGAETNIAGVGQEATGDNFVAIESLASELMNPDLTSSQNTSDSGLMLQTEGAVNTPTTSTHEIEDSKPADFMSQADEPASRETSHPSVKPGGDNSDERFLLDEVSRSLRDNLQSSGTLEEEGLREMEELCVRTLRQQEEQEKAAGPAAGDCTNSLQQLLLENASDDADNFLVDF